MALVGPKSVSGIQVGPAELVVRKLVVFHTPPLAPAAKTVFPEVSDGSMASPVTRPAPPASDISPPLPVLEPIAADPTAVQAWLDNASVWPSRKRRNDAPMLSVPGWPRPVVGSGFW